MRSKLYFLSTWEMFIDVWFGLGCDSNVHDPRALAAILEKAEADLAAKLHPDPYTGGY